MTARRPTEPADASKRHLPVPSRSDLLQLVRLMPLGLISWLLPISWLWPISCAIGGMTRLWKRRSHPTDLLISRTFRTRLSAAESAAIAARWRNRMREQSMLMLALLPPWRRWQPAIRWHGMEHLTRALELGSGAILWMTGVYTTPILHIALRRAGIAHCVLARPEHGFSTSPFFIRFINPFWIKVEARYLAERILITDDDPGRALLFTGERLKSNRAICIALGRQAWKLVPAPFRDVELQVPTGPINLAHTFGATLLPVFVFRADDGCYEITVEPPLPTDPAADLDYRAIAQNFATLLEPLALRHPDQFGWETVGLVATPQAPKGPRREPGPRSSS